MTSPTPRQRGMTVRQVLAALADADDLDQEVMATSLLDLEPNFLLFSVDSDEITGSMLLCLSRLEVR